MRPEYTSHGNPWFRALLFAIVLTPPALAVINEFTNASLFHEHRWLRWVQLGCYVLLAVGGIIFLRRSRRPAD